MKTHPRLLLSALFAALVVGSLFAQQPFPVPPPSMRTLTGDPGLALSAIQQASPAEQQKFYAGVNYIQATDPDVKKLAAAVQAVTAEMQRRVELAQIDADLLLYRKLKEFDPSTAKLAEAKLAELAERKKRADEAAAKTPPAK